MTNSKRVPKMRKLTMIFNPNECALKMTMRKAVIPTAVHQRQSKVHNEVDPKGFQILLLCLLIQHEELLLHLALLGLDIFFVAKVM